MQLSNKNFMVRICLKHRDPVRFFNTFQEAEKYAFHIKKKLPKVTITYINLEDRRHIYWLF